MKSYNQLKEFELYAANYCKRVDGETKLSGKIEKAFGLMKDVIANHSKEENDLRRDYCYTEKDLIVRSSDGKYQYTKANEKKLDNAIRQLRNKAIDIDFSSCYVMDAPVDLSHGEVESFRGIVLSEDMYSELIVKFD